MVTKETALSGEADPTYATVTTTATARRRDRTAQEDASTSMLVPFAIRGSAGYSSILRQNATTEHV